MAAIARAFPQIPSASAKPTAETKAEARKLWLCAYFPDLALESLQLDLEQAVAVLDSVRGKPCLQCVSAQARQVGVETGMTTAAAQALCPQLMIRMRDQEAEREALQKLAEAALNFSPLVSSAPPCAVLLEVRSCLTLFGGAESLREKLRQAMLALHHRPVIAMTPSAEASTLLARQGRETMISNRHALRSALGPLPVAALDLDAKSARRLHNAGIRQLTDLWRLPRDGLARRYGPGLVKKLDALSGNRDIVLSGFKRPPRFYARREMPIELERVEHFFFAIEQLALEFAAFLQRGDTTALAINLTLSHHGRSATRLPLEFRRGSRDPEHWLMLLREKLERLPLPAPIIAVALSSRAIVPFQPEAVTLFDMPGDSADDNAWQAVLDQLQARLGHSALQQTGLQDDHRPERALALQGQAHDCEFDLPPRPLWLLAKPEAVDIAALQLLPQTERIESGWWDGFAVRRDYRVAFDSRGRKLWIFRDLNAEGGWYLHGLFG